MESDHPDRFRRGTEEAWAHLASLSAPEGAYLDVFTQQIVRRTVYGRVNVRSGRMTPVSLNAKARVTEGVAFRRLGKRTAFFAENGLGPDKISLAAEAFAASDLTRPAVPVHTSEELPIDQREDLAYFIREVCDAIVSLVEECTHLTVGVSSFNVQSGLSNSLDHHHTAARRRTETRIELDTHAGDTKATWVDWDADAPISVRAEELAGELHRRIERRLKATDVLPVNAAVLLPPGWGGTWMHEAVGHLLEADTALSMNSTLYDRLGSRVSIDAVTIVDDGSLRPSRAECVFDDEGVGGAPTLLIEEGIVVGLLTDRTTASHSGLPLTGNGRRPHFGLPPKPRMTNVLLRPGGSERGELISATDEVIIVDRIRHAWLNAEDGRLYLEIDEAQLSRRGESIGYLQPFVASAEPLKLLGDVVDVGNDFAIDLNHGYCLKDGAALPVTIGQPSVLVRSMQIESKARL